MADVHIVPTNKHVPGIDWTCAPDRILVAACHDSVPAQTEQCDCIATPMLQVPVVAHLHANEGPEAAIRRKLADEFGVAVPGHTGGDKAGAAGGNGTADTSASAGEPLLVGPITPLHEHRMQLPCCVENELTESFVLQVCRQGAGTASDVATAGLYEANTISASILS